jgi:hypothetical protein
MRRTVFLTVLLAVGLAFLVSAGSDAMVAPSVALRSAATSPAITETAALRKGDKVGTRRGAARTRHAAARHRGGAVKSRQAAVKHRGVAVKSRQAAVKHRGGAVKSRQAAVKHRGVAVKSRQAAVKHRGVAMKSQQAAVKHPGAAARTRHAAVKHRSVAPRRTQVAVGKGGPGAAGTPVVVRPVRPWVRQPYYGTIMDGVPLGTVIAANTVPPAPSFDLCWYWSNTPKTRGYWDYCQ